MSEDLIPSPAQAHTMNQLELLKKLSAGGQEYWFAREILPVLGYETWRRFQDVIERAKAACAGNQLNHENHFVQTGKMVGVGSEASREIADYFLSRPACYLIAMNGDPTKPQIAAAQVYFAVQTRRMELDDHKSEDQKRLELRKKVSQSFRRVSSVAKNAGVRNSMQGVFHDARFRGLYLSPAAAVKRAKGLKERDNLFDYAAPLELSAHDFQMNLAADVIDRERVKVEQQAINKNLEIAQKVRGAIDESGATLPENLKLAERITVVKKRIAASAKTKKLPKPPNAS